MKIIPLTRIKKDNSNVTYYSKTLCKALRQERFKPLKQEQYERFFNYCLAANQLAGDPYEDIDFQIDLAKFRDTLSIREAECLGYFMDNVKQEDISKLMGVSQTLVSFILSTIFIKFSAFYCENIEEDTGILEFKRHLRKAELLCFESYLEGLSIEDTVASYGMSKSVVTAVLNSVFMKFHAFFGVKIDG